jgi:hypothetical protein
VEAEGASGPAEFSTAPADDASIDTAAVPTGAVVTERKVDNAGREVELDGSAQSYLSAYSCFPAARA